MSRPTTLQHPIATLRSVIELGRQQFATYLGISPVMLEKIERGERVFSPNLMDRMFKESGVCPGWLSNPTTPIHTADGHPYSALEWTRWRGWKESKVPVESLKPGTTSGAGGRRLGPHYSKACCPGLTRLLANIELNSTTLTKAQLRKVQANCKAYEAKELADQLVDLARGAADQGFADQDTDSLLKAMSALRKIFPKARLTPDPRDQKELERMQDELEKIGRQEPLPSPPPAAPSALNSPEA